MTTQKFTYDQLSNIACALTNHALACEKRAEAIYSDRSSDKTYDQNAALSFMGSRYREQAAALQETLRAVLHAQREWQDAHDLAEALSARDNMAMGETGEFDSDY
jgi:hypothetical protein